MLVVEPRPRRSSTTSARRHWSSARRSFRVYPLKYTDYAVAREEDLARERALVERQQALIDKTEDFIRKNIAGQKTKQAQSRRKMLDKLDRLERPEDVWQAPRRSRSASRPRLRTGDIVLDCKGLGAERGGRVLFAGVDLLVRRGERIGIVGPNGSGKTTLLKLLAGRGVPDDAARSSAARTSKRATSTSTSARSTRRSPRSTRSAACAATSPSRPRGSTSRASASAATTRSASSRGFSGGERSRLALAKLLLEPRNLLFLDEPTNHLDIPAAEILEEALVGFEGTVILVSHDRRFLENTTTRIVSVRDGTVDVYPGGFRDYVASQALKGDETEKLERSRGRRERDDGGASRGAQKKSEPPPAPAKDAEGAKKAAFEAQRLAVRTNEKRKRRIEELEKAIADGDAQLALLRAKLKEDPGGDWAKIAELASQEQSLAKRVDLMMTEWARLSVEQR